MNYNVNVKIVFGCNRLEDPNFKGIYRCENYIEIKNKKIFKNILTDMI